MKSKIIIEIKNGVLTGVYSDWLDAIETTVILRDIDNIEAGDIDPIPLFEVNSYNILY